MQAARFSKDHWECKMELPSLSGWSQLSLFLSSFSLCGDEGQGSSACFTITSQACSRSQRLAWTIIQFLNHKWKNDQKTQNEIGDSCEIRKLPVLAYWHTKCCLQQWQEKRILFNSLPSFFFLLYSVIWCCEFFNNVSESSASLKERFIHVKVTKHQWWNNFKPHILLKARMWNTNIKEIIPLLSSPLRVFSFSLTLSHCSLQSTCLPVFNPTN